jgi:DNA invertase Pin-like site-specific DNA recombinase
MKPQPTPRLIGYARVSTDEQLNDSQLIELKGAGCHSIFEEQGSGASRARPVLARLVREIKAGCVAIWRI